LAHTNAKQFNKPGKYAVAVTVQPQHFPDRAAKSNLSGHFHLSFALFYLPLGQSNENNFNQYVGTEAKEKTYQRGLRVRVKMCQPGIKIPILIRSKRSSLGFAAINKTLDPAQDRNF